jgi:CRISPR/Cas system CSM-associated protein Csm5 (group 7 of RAMP superfamily)
MNPKNLTQKFKITVLTPVHIGSGFRKMKGIDFYTMTKPNSISD